MTFTECALEHPRVRPILELFTVPPFEVNVYLLGDETSRESIVVDPGGRSPEIAEIAEDRGLLVKAIVCTHAHIDHVSGAASLKELTGAPLWLHADGELALSSLEQQARLFGLPPIEVPEVDGHLVPGQAIEVGEMRLTVHETPGHAPGHITLVGEEIEVLGLDLADLPVAGASSHVAFCGDVIFRGSIGRTDLPGGDFHQLMRSIERVILPLPDDTVLLSGHGPATTVGDERRHNPFVREWLQRWRR